MLTPLRLRPVALAGLAALVSCGPALPDPAPEAEKLRQASLEQLGSNTKHCTAQRKATEPDLFGWDSGSRAKVKATAEQGLVVVHFEQHGCDIALAVLNCTTSKTAYHYTPRHAQQTRFAENDADLYAHFPVAVADLRGRLGADRAIRADYRMEGIDMIPIGTTIEPKDLRGSECDAATHVVSAIHRGAFAVAAASLSELRAGGNLFEASAKQKLGIFDGDGFQEACDGARTKGTRASGCDEPLRIELQPLQLARRALPRPCPRRSPYPCRSPCAVDRARAAPPPAPAPPRAARSLAARAVAALKRSADPFSAPPAPAPGGACTEAMVRIPGGSFAPSFDDDHHVTVGRYCLDRTEVTVAAYAHCPRCRAPSAGGWCNGPGMGKDDHPQNCVSWNDAVTYCAWLGKRLPTEAEWEFAARGGGTHQLWPWGNAPAGSDHACYNRWSVEDRGTCAVGRFPEGSFGLADMAGNVWEWVADWYGPFAPGDPQATPTKGVGRVMRGGAWTSSSFVDIGTSSRAATWPTNRDDYLGFRCAS